MEDLHKSMPQTHFQSIWTQIGRGDSFFAHFFEKIMHFLKKIKNCEKIAQKTYLVSQFESKWTGNGLVACSHVDLSFECRNLNKNTFLADFWSSKDGKIAKLTKIQIFSQNLHEKPISSPNVGPNGLEMGLWHDFM